MVDAIVSHPHYVDHLLPIWRALPPEVRGTFTARTRAMAYAQRLGVKATPRVNPTTKTLTLVASTVDYNAAMQLKRPVVFVNHGVGQSWRDERGNLLPSGCAAYRPGAVAFLAPGPHAAAIIREANGDSANVVEVGSAKVEELTRIPPPAKPLVVFSTHWDHKLVPESRSVLSEYLESISKLRGEFSIALHSHPRARVLWTRIARELRLTFIDSFKDVCARASVYVIDSSSTLFEFAALNRPVVVLNGTNYRRSHKHGLRFWDYAHTGVNVDSPKSLAEGIRCAIADSPEQQSLRAAGVKAAYYPLDGGASNRAVKSILNLL